MKSTRRSFLKAAGALTGGLVVAGPTAAHSMLSRDLTTRTLWAMGMPITYSVPTEATGNISNSFSAITRVDEYLSVYKHSSALTRLNSGVSVNDLDLARVCSAAKQFGELTQGHFDVTVLPILRKMGFRPSERSFEALSKIDFRQVNVVGSTVHLSGVAQVDLGGIAKGYAIDEAADVLRSDGIQTALVEAGGDVFAIGIKPDGSKWTIGIRDPRNSSQLFATIQVADSAIATSGGYFQNRIVDGKMATHLINPLTGESDSEVLSATIVASSAMTADALATASSVQPRAEAQSIVESMNGVEAVWVYRDGSIFVTSGLRKDITIL